MNFEENKKLVLLIADDIWNKGKLMVCDEIMSIDAKYHGRFESSKIIEAWEQLDLLGMWRQLGFISLPSLELKGGKR